jgi:hypothetical protein
VPGVLPAGSMPSALSGGTSARKSSWLSGGCSNDSRAVGRSTGQREGGGMTLAGAHPTGSLPAALPGNSSTSS